MIDLNRGVQIRKHATGMEICMYKDRPGEYYTITGSPIPDGRKLAREAGFNVESLDKDRQRLKDIADATSAINEKFGIQKPEVVSERAGFKLIHTGLGRHTLEDPDGNVLNDRPWTIQEAQQAFAALAGEDEVETAPDKEK